MRALDVGVVTLAAPYTPAPLQVRSTPTRSTMIKGFLVPLLYHAFPPACLASGSCLPTLLTHSVQASTYLVILILLESPFAQPTSPSLSS